MALTKTPIELSSTPSIVDGGNATAITIDSSENTAFSGSVSISHNAGDSLTLTKTTTEPSLRIEGDTDKDFVLTVSGEKLTITQNDGSTDIALFDHDTKATTLKGNVEIAGEIDLDTTDDLRLRFYDGGTFKAGLEVATSANDMISGSGDGDFAIRAQGNMVFSAGGNLMQQALDTNGQLTLYGYNAGNGFAVPQDQSTGYTNNLNAGTFGVLHRAAYDAYITSNAYYYKTGGTAGWKAKYPAYKSGVLSMLDGRFVFGCSSAAPGGSGIVGVDGLQDRVRIDSDGIKFGSDTATANALDDYEEGTWTPVLKGYYGNTGLTATQGSVSGYYTKIGRLVNIRIHFDGAGIAASGNSDIVAIGGLPFTATNGYEGSGPFLANAVNLTQSHANWNIIGASEIAMLGNNGSGGGWAWQTGVCFATSGVALRISMTYATAT